MKLQIDVSMETLNDKLKGRGLVLGHPILGLIGNSPTTTLVVFHPDFFVLYGRHPDLDIALQEFGYKWSWLE